MGIRDTLKDLFATKTEIEYKEAPRVVLNMSSGAYYRKDNYENYADEGYRQNAIVYRCVNEIAQGAASINFKVFQNEEELEVHPLKNLLNRPNPVQSGVEYFQALYSYLLLSGNSYAIRTDVAGEPKELYLLRPDRMRIKAGKTQMPDGYEYVLNGRVVESYEADPEDGNSVVKHFKMFNPLDDFYGCSPLMAASVDIDQHNEVAKHNISLLMNGARPSGAVIFKPLNDRGVPMQLTDSQRMQLREDMDNKLKGTVNAGRPLLLEGDFDWKEMGLSPKDMDFLQQRHMASKDIALVFGVPSQLIGVPDSQTYANVQEARLALYEETIIPLARRVENDINEWLAPQFGEEIRVTYDIDSIPAMTERRRRVYENVVAAVREGIITRNEARDRLGMEPIDGGDDIYIAANLFPLGSTATPPEPDGKAEDNSEDAYGIKDQIDVDVFTTEEEAQDRANEIGCVGTHSHETADGLVFMPCESHDDYDRLVNGVEEQSKAESDVDTTPTEEMANDARRGLEMRKEFGRGGTSVGVARARQLINKQRLSPSVVRRMFSFFSRHEVDKRAEGFRQGEAGYPSAGKIAWLLWGGDSGFRWSRRKVAELDKARDNEKEIESFVSVSYSASEEKAEPLTGAIKKTIAKKVSDHNDEHGDKRGKRVTQRMLEAVFRRGVGAYRTNPESVRPNVQGPEQWGIARVNVFLRAVRTGRFPSGKFDTDLLPKGHPLRTGDD
ncbi:MAG: phage portal protein [Betaproteobacteria bacterium]